MKSGGREGLSTLVLQLAFKFQRFNFFNVLKDIKFDPNGVRIAIFFKEKHTNHK